MSVGSLRARIGTTLRQLFVQRPPESMRANFLLNTSDGWRSTHRHKKGGEYRVLAHGILEADRSEVVVYDDEEGTVWVRPKTEFCDGRFAATDTVGNSV